MINIEKGKTSHGFEYQVETENGNWNGLYKEFYENGSLRETGFYDNDKRVGKFSIYYNDERQLLFAEHFYEGEADPEIKVEYSYFKNGKLKTKKTKSSKMNEQLNYNELGEVELRVDNNYSEPLGYNLRNSKFSDIRENMLEFVRNNYEDKTASLLALETINNKNEVINSFNLARLSQDLKKIISGKETGKDAHHKGYDLRAPKITDNIEWLLKFSGDIENDRKELEDISKKNSKARFLYIQRIEEVKKNKI